MSSGLYNEGLFREGLLRTTNLVRPGLITQFDTLEEALTRFAVNGVEAALALDFIGSEYRTGNTETTFADAFTGNSPKLTYDPGSASSSQSTMVNSSGNIVWAPHNLLTYSEGFSQSWGTSSSTLTSVSNVEAPDGSYNVFEVSNTANGGRIRNDTNVISGAEYTYGIFMKYVDHQWIAIAHNNSGTPYFTWFDIQNGAKGSNAPADTSITPVGNGWYLIQAPQIANDTTSYFEVHLATGDDQTAESVGTSAYVFGAHVYRSDLGGMAPVPGAATGFETYVPTNGAAEYLPRVGHHVYNGSTWVNEGLFLESEARTNLFNYSNDPDLVDGGGGDAGLTVSANTEDDPAGSAAASIITASTINSFFGPRYTSGATGQVYTASFIVKNNGSAQSRILVRNSVDAADITVSWDGATLTSTTDTSGSSSTEPLGGNYYKISVTYTATEGTQKPRLYPDTSDGSNSLVVYAWQLEQASTPSSYIPTDGSTVTRGGQSLTVPPAEFGWPEPEYIGPELVDNGDFTSGLTGWNDTAVTNSGGTVSVSVEGEATVTRGTARAEFYQVITTEIGKVYGFNGSVLSQTVGATLWIGSARNNASDLSISGAPNGLASGQFVATDTSLYVTLVVGGQEGDAITFDNISVREINPLSVSIQMDGRITYADEGVTSQARFYRWGSSSSDRIQNRLYTDTGTGGVNVYQSATNGGSASSDFDNVYTPGINVPFNVASRHGSTFINGAVDGVALTANTTPTALPDLSSTNLQIAYDFMGTVGQFRQFAGDIGDAGLVTATNPSTEPTLSLTFDGTAGGSFYNLSWSE